MRWVKENIYGKKEKRTQNITLRKFNIQEMGRWRKAWGGNEEFLSQGLYFLYGGGGEVIFWEWGTQETGKGRRFGIGGGWETRTNNLSNKVNGQNSQEYQQLGGKEKRKPRMRQKIAKFRLKKIQEMVSQKTWELRVSRKINNKWNRKIY